MGSYQVNNILRSLLFIIILISNVGCSAQEHQPFGYEINAYRQLVGIQENQLQKTFGKLNVTSAKLPLHDPETYEDGLEVIVKQESIYFKIKRGVIISVVFRSSKFKTDRNVYVGMKYCEIISTYPDATFSFGYEDGGYLYLLDDNDGILFDFTTVELPLSQYISEGMPDKNSPSLCKATVNSIELKTK